MIYLSVIIIFFIFLNLLRLRDLITQQRKMKKYTEFLNRLLVWSREPNDVKIRLEILDFISCLQESNELTSRTTLKNVSKLENEVIDRWGKYIPSLKSNIRNNKIDLLLNK